MKKSNSHAVKNVLVFGGAGFLGSHIVDVLSEEGYHVTIFDQRPSTTARPGIRSIIGDIRDMSSVQKALKGIDAVYHFAGFADLESAASSSLETVRQNIEGTVTILEASVKAGIQRFVYASTIYVYSELGGFYRCSKQSCELYVEEFARRYGIAYTVLRYGTLYGPRADERNSIWRYLHQALTENRVEFPGSGEETREYIHVRDAAKLSVKALADSFRNQHVIVTGHHPMKAKDMLCMIQEILQNRVKLVFKKNVSTSHYDVTPYSYMPKVGQKLVSNLYVDMGQGLLECLHEIDGQRHGAHTHKVAKLKP